MSSFRKFVFLFLAIVVVAAGGYFVWNRFFSPEAAYERKMLEGQRLYQQAVDIYQQQQREDIYGGKTPEETLKLFIEALRERNVELASKYFVLKFADLYAVQKEYKESLLQAKDEGRIEEIIKNVERLVLSNRKLASADGVEYIARDENGVVEYSAILRKIDSTGIWKIESL